MATTTSYNGGFIGAMQAQFSGPRDYTQVAGSTTTEANYTAQGKVAVAVATQVAASFTALSVTIPATASEQTMLAAIVAGLLDGKDMTDISTSTPNSYVSIAEIAALAYQEALSQAGGVLT